MQQVPIIMNPTAGGGRLLRARTGLDAAARGHGCELLWWPTEAPGHAAELAREAADEGFPLVFAFGGDGTYNEVARGLVGSSTALGFLPGGTTSVLAFEFAIPRPAERALQSMLVGQDRAMRIGCSDRGDIILIMLSSGPDALVLDRLMPRLKRFGGKAGVAAQALLELLRWRSLPRLRLVVDHQELDCAWVIAGKARCYAGPYHATPAADPFSPKFEIVALEGSGRRAAVPFALGLPFGRHLRRRDVRRFQVDSFRLEPADDSDIAAYQVDGDLIGPVPVEVGIHPEELHIRLPG